MDKAKHTAGAAVCFKFSALDGMLQTCYDNKLRKKGFL